MYPCLNTLKIKMDVLINNTLVCRSYPVALDASAELLERRAFTSMIQYSREDGCRAYWILHSPTMPRWRTTLIAVSLSMWYSSLDRVWLGATTMESPLRWPERAIKWSARGFTMHMMWLVFKFTWVYGLWIWMCVCRGQWKSLLKI